MALVDAKCTNCNGIVQLDENAKVNFCLYCGGRILVKDAIDKFRSEESGKPKSRIEGLDAELLHHRLDEAMELLNNGSYSKAERIFTEILAKEPNYEEASWGLVLTATKNLTPTKIETPDDFAYSQAMELFEEASGEKKSQWSSAYEDAFYKSCVLSAEAYDPRVFVEVEVFRWNKKENRFEYAIDRRFNLDVLLTKHVTQPLNKLLEALPEDKQEDFSQHIDQACTNISAYFTSGFSNVDQIMQGDITRLLGTWYLKQSNGDIKADVLRFSLNSVNVLHCEAMRLAFNSYDFFRFVKMESNQNLSCREMRHFPSSVGAGGDFLNYGAPHEFLPIFAIYDFVLVLPTAIYSRADIKSIPGVDSALVFQKKCLTMTTFQRNEGKSGVQIRPIIENYETADPSKKVSSCYIATAVYGDVEAPQVRALRAFRDGTLNRHLLGRKFTDWYYRHSPHWAEWLKKRRLLNAAVRTCLNLTLKILKKIR